MKPLTIKTKKTVIALLSLIILALVGYGVYVMVSRSDAPQFTDGSLLSTISLEGSDGGLYEWNFTIEDTTVAEVVDKTSTIEYEQPQHDGGTPTMHYIIKGKKPGKTKITFRYGSFASGETLREHTYLIEVNAKLENKVTEQK